MSLHLYLWPVCCFLCSSWYCVVTKYSFAPSWTLMIKLSHAKVSFFPTSWPFWCAQIITCSFHFSNPIVKLNNAKQLPINRRNGGLELDFNSEHCVCSTEKYMTRECVCVCLPHCNYRRVHSVSPGLTKTSCNERRWKHNMKGERICHNVWYVLSVPTSAFVRSLVCSHICAVEHLGTHMCQRKRRET